MLPLTIVSKCALTLLEVSCAVVGMAIRLWMTAPEVVRVRVGVHS